MRTLTVSRSVPSYLIDLNADRDSSIQKIRCLNRSIASPIGFPTISSAKKPKIRFYASKNFKKILTKKFGKQRPQFGKDAIWIFSNFFEILSDFFQIFSKFFLKNSKKNQNRIKKKFDENSSGKIRNSYRRRSLPDFRRSFRCARFFFLLNFSTSKKPKKFLDRTRFALGCRDL